jgi:hypothetical protein
MAKREDTAIRRSLASILPKAKIKRLAKQTGAVHRRRKVDIVAFVYALVLGFSTNAERTIAGLRRTFERAAGVRLAPSAFYDRFTEPLTRLLERLIVDALRTIAQRKPRMRGVCERFREVLACDASLLRLHNALEEFYPSVFTHYMKASAKLCVVMNVIGRGVKTIGIFPGSTHDLNTIRVGRSLAGRLLVFDLGYFRSELFREIGNVGGYYLTRLKQHNNPLILATNRPEHRWLVGWQLTDALHYLVSDTLDLEVELRYALRRGPRRGRHTLRARIVGLRDPESKELRLYVTIAPQTHLQARHVAAIYAARWEIELLFRELKLRYRIEQTSSKRRWVTESLIYAAILTLLVAHALRRWLIAKHRALADRAPFERWAILVEAFSLDLLDIAVGPRDLRVPLARRLVPLLLHEAMDPNRWRMHLVDRAGKGTLLEHRNGA